MFSIVFSSGKKRSVVDVKIVVVNLNLTYNAILEYPTLTAEVTSITHYKLKFPVGDGVEEVKGNLDIAKTCYKNTFVSTSGGVSKHKNLKIEMEPFTERLTDPIAA